MFFVITMFWSIGTSLACYGIYLLTNAIGLVFIIGYFSGVVYGLLAQDIKNYFDEFPGGY